MIEFFDWSRFLAGAALGIAVMMGMRKIDRVRKLNDDLAFIEACAEEANSAISMASEVIGDTRTPGVIRETIFMLLQGLREISVGEWLHSRLSRQPMPADPSQPGEISKAISHLREIDAVLADKVERTLVGLTDVALPLASRRRTFPRINRRMSSPTQTLLALDRTMHGSQNASIGHLNPA